jgi:tRNA modification GTPase
MYFNDTIAAISTPVGEGGIGIIRISGAKAREIGDKLLRNSNGRPFKEVNDHQVYYGLVVDPQTNAPVDEVLFFYTKNPRSYTTEDTVEIQTHGGMFVVKRILELALQNGARMAEPGEFTQRAFLNGRIDLVQAESIIDLIRAKTAKAHQLALTQLTGKTTREIHRLEDELYQILIAIEAILDFPEEGLPDLERKQVIEKVTKFIDELNLLLKNSDEGRMIRDGIVVTIVGRPNVGKSSLLNRFLQEERAIVTEFPGTTRDIIDAQLQLRGVPVRLIDTAGIRETDNPVERIGIQKAEQYIKDADLILFLLDGSEPLDESDREVITKIQGKKILAVINKNDLPQRLSQEELAKIIDSKIIELSLVTGGGFETLENEIIEIVGIGKIQTDDTPLLSRVRHKRALEKGVSFLREFKTGLEAGTSEDLLAVDLRSCLEAIGEITGKNVSEEVVHGIFEQFCIGK